MVEDSPVCLLLAIIKNRSAKSGLYLVGAVTGSLKLSKILAIGNGSITEPAELTFFTIARQARPPI